MWHASSVVRILLNLFSFIILLLEASLRNMTQYNKHNNYNFKKLFWGLLLTGLVFGRGRPSDELRYDERDVTS